MITDMIYRIINYNFNSTIFVVIFTILMFGVGCDPTSNVERQMSNVKSNDGLEAGLRSEIITTKFVDSYEFARTAGIDVKEVDGYPVAGIVNHHSLAMDLQARFFKSLESFATGYR